MSSRITELAWHALAAALGDVHARFLANLFGPLGQRGIEVSDPFERPLGTPEDSIPVLFVDPAHPPAWASPAPVSFRLVTVLNHGRTLRPHLVCIPFSCAPYWLGLAVLQALHQFHSVVHKAGGSAVGTTLALDDRDTGAFRDSQIRRLVESYVFVAQLFDERTKGWLSRTAIAIAERPALDDPDRFYRGMTADAMGELDQLYFPPPLSPQEKVYRFDLVERMLRLHAMGVTPFTEWLAATD